MTITTKVTATEYARMMLGIYYKNPLIILMSLSGVSAVTLAVLSYAGVVPSPRPIFLLVFGLYIVCLPVLVYLRSKRNFRTNKRIQETINYTFTPERLVMQGETFTGEYAGSTMHKIVETGALFLLYSSNRVALVIPKKDLAASALPGLRELLRGIPGVKMQLR